MVCNFCIPCIIYANTEVEIPVGTTVLLAFQSAVHPMTANVGEKVFLTVVNDIEVDGYVVIKAGAHAIGEISQSVKKGSIGKPATIGVLLRSVEAVNGKNISLSGSKVLSGEDKQSDALLITILCCVLGLMMKGGDVEMAQGTTVEGTVLVSTKVQL